MKSDFDRMILIDKPAGMSSFGVVARIRRVLTEQYNAERKEQNLPPVKHLKVGHTGTLDPFATGLLIIMTGRRTKDCAQFLKHDKEYIATLELGKTSTTGDPEGEIKEYESDDGEVGSVGVRSVTGDEGEVRLAAVRSAAARARAAVAHGDGSTERVREPHFTEITRILKTFTGPQLQKVPAFSAVKINGRRAYDLARQGKTPETPTRPIEIYALELLDYSYPTLKIRAHVSSGTYIRTLAEDIGKALGTGAYLTALRRTKIADYSVDDANTLADFGIL